MGAQVAKTIEVPFNYGCVSTDFAMRAPNVAPNQTFSIMEVSARITETSSVFNLHTQVKINKSNQQIAKTIGEEWYDRIHLIPSVTELGNLLSAQMINIEIWNGFFVPRTLTSITESGTDGILLEEPAGTPLVYNPLQSHKYKVHVDIVGPPAVDGKYKFNFDVYTVTFTVVGNRVVVLSIVPQADFTEVLAWKTDIIKTKGSEQRISLRPVPRQSLSYDYLLSERDFTTMKNTMQEWSHRVFSVPLWADAEFVGVVATGSMSLPVDDSMADYIVNGMALIFQDQYHYEAVEILDINSGSVGLKAPVKASYTSAFIMPVILSQIEGGFSFKRGANEVIKGSVTFQGTTTNDIGFSAKTQHKGKDILLKANALVSSVKEVIKMDVTKIDTGLGVIVLDPKRNEHEHSQTISFDMTTREELWETRRWIHSKQGRQKSFYVLTWNRDLILTEPLTAADVALKVKGVKYSLYVDNMDIAILKKDGSVLIRESTGAVDNGDGTESVVVTEQMGEDLALDDIDRICFITLVRMNADRIEIKHRANRQATIVIPVTRVME